MLEIEEGWNGADNGKISHRINYGCCFSVFFPHAWDESICGVAQQFANFVQITLVYSILAKTVKRMCRKQRFDRADIILRLETFQQLKVILICVEVGQPALCYLAVQESDIK